MVYVEHELLVRDFPGTKVGSLENLKGDRSVSPQIPAVNLRAPAEGRIEDRRVCWVKFELSSPEMSERPSCRTGGKDKSSGRKYLGYTVL